jgi:hypothetical protein
MYTGEYVLGGAAPSQIRLTAEVSSRYAMGVVYAKTATLAVRVEVFSFRDVGCLAVTH